MLLFLQIYRQCQHCLKEPVSTKARARTWRACLAVVQVCSLLVLFSGCASQPRLLIAPPETPVAYDLVLPRPVPHVMQRTNGTCWLACAAMIYGYYGNPMTERAIDVGVKRLTLDDRGGQLEGSIEDCIVALGYADSPRAKRSVDDPANYSSHLPEVSRFNLVLSTLATPATADPHSIVKALAREEPAVLICRRAPWDEREHAMIVTGARLGRIGGDPEKLGIISLTVLDPADPDGKAIMKDGEYLKSNFRSILTRSIAERILNMDQRSSSP